MREYDVKAIYFGFLKKSKSIKRKNIARIYKNRYFSMFLKVNEKDYFDLSDGELISSSDLKLIYKLSSKKEYTSEKELRKIIEYNLKTL